MKDDLWLYKSMNGAENVKLPFPEDCIINETVLGYDSGKEIEDILSRRHTYDVNSPNEFGHTPLSTAAYAGSLKYVKLLVELGADITFKDSDGWTALHFATATKNYEIAKFLMSVGADTKDVTKDGQKPLDFVKDKNTRIFLAKYGERCAMSNLRTSYC